MSNLKWLDGNNCWLYVEEKTAIILEAKKKRSPAKQSKILDAIEQQLKSFNKSIKSDIWRDEIMSTYSLFLFD